MAMQLMLFALGILLYKMASTTRSSEGPNEQSSPLSTPFGPPFDDADAEIILRSSDLVDFYIYRAMLSKTSPLFKTMFSLPQPDASVSEKQRPVIDLTEDGETIAALLSFIYPLAPESISLRGMIGARVAAEKYDMAVIFQHLDERFGVSKIVQDSPVEAFCAAYSHKLGEAARAAARASLKYGMSLDDIGDKLQYTNGPALFQLWKYHRACSAATAKLVSDKHLAWITDSDSDTEPHRTLWSFARSTCTTCSCWKYHYTVGPSRTRWDVAAPWHTYITQAHAILLERPYGKAVAHRSVVGPIFNLEACHICRNTLAGLPAFVDLLRKEVETRVSEVRHFLAHPPDTSPDGSYRRSI